VTEAGTRTLIRKPPRAASDVGRSRLGDLTRPVAKEQRITRNRRPALLLGAIGLVVAVAIGAALFGLPVRTWFAQDDDIARLDHQLSELQAVNDELLQEVNALQTPEGVMAAARETLGYKQINEDLQTVVDLPDLPADLPDGWPYGPVEQILRLRGVPAAPAPPAAPAQPAGG
jgi:cell division protein FtsB